MLKEKRDETRWKEEDISRARLKEKGRRGARLFEEDRMELG